MEQRWHIRAQRLAEMENRPVGDVTSELMSFAQDLAARKRDDQLTELARDLAVSRALGQKLKPPWRRRIQLLGQIMGLPSQAVRDEVESLASNVTVVVQS